MLVESYHHTDDADHVRSRFDGEELDEQIKSLQERQAQLKARENDLVARRRERERRARTKRLIEVGAMAESAAGFEGGDERAKERIARLVQLGSLVESLCSTT